MVNDGFLAMPPQIDKLTPILNFEKTYVSINWVVASKEYNGDTMDVVGLSGSFVTIVLRPHWNDGEFTVKGIILKWPYFRVVNY